MQYLASPRAQKWMLETFLRFRTWNGTKQVTEPSLIEGERLWHRQEYGKHGFLGGYQSNSLWQKGKKAHLLFFSFLFYPHLRIYLLILETGGGGERERHQREKHQSAASHVYPNWGSDPQPSYVHWLGIEPANFWCTGQCFNQLSHLARAIFLNWVGIWWGLFKGKVNEGKNTKICLYLKIYL